MDAKNQTVKMPMEADDSLEIERAQEALAAAEKNLKMLKLAAKAKAEKKGIFIHYMYLFTIRECLIIFFL